MKINILDILNSDLAVNVSDGVLVYERISNILPSDLIISFDGIKRLSTAFLNESIGKYAILFPEEINLVSFVDIPSSKNIFNYKITDVIENALMGDDYDSLVDKATLV